MRNRGFPAPVESGLAKDIAMRARPAVAALLLAAALGGCATETPTSAAADPPRQCFYGRNVQNFVFADDRTVNFRVAVNDVWRLKISSPCTGARFVQGLALQTRGGTDLVCSGLDAELLVPTPAPPQRCFVQDIHKLTVDEVAALDPKYKP